MNVWGDMMRRFRTYCSTMYSIRTEEGAGTRGFFLMRAMLQNDEVLLLEKEEGEQCRGAGAACLLCGERCVLKGRGGGDSVCVYACACKSSSPTHGKDHIPRSASREYM